MEEFINSRLHPVEICIICTEPFGVDHHPVSLPCKHIFGHECIKKWLRIGRGNNTSCPQCRDVIVQRKSARTTFDVPSIWQSVCEQPPERLHAFMTEVWSGIRLLWQRKTTGKFSVTDLLDSAIIPALVRTTNPTAPRQRREHDPLLDCYNLIAASWDSLGRPDTATGLALPLVRLARLMSSVSNTIPKWLTTVVRINHLFWKANACLSLTTTDICWDTVMTASHNMAETQHFPLLHLYTVLISQSISHSAEPKIWPNRRHEVMNLVVERCCKKISNGDWSSKPSNDFKDVLAIVYEELRRCQLKKKMPSLRGHEDEESVVKGIWALAIWGMRRG